MSVTVKELRELLDGVDDVDEPPTAVYWVTADDRRAITWEQARIVLDAAGVQGLVEALEKWKCEKCGGRKQLTSGLTERVKCLECNGTGLHPIASEALTTWRGQK